MVGGGARVCVFFLLREGSCFCWVGGGGRESCAAGRGRESDSGPAGGGDGAPFWGGGGPLDLARRETFVVTHRMMLSWPLSSCRNMISRKVRCACFFFVEGGGVVDSREERTALAFFFFRTERARFRGSGAFSVRRPPPARCARAPPPKTSPPLSPARPWRSGRRRRSSSGPRRSGSSCRWPSTRRRTPAVVFVFLGADDGGTATATGERARERERERARAPPPTPPTTRQLPSGAPPLSQSSQRAGRCPAAICQRAAHAGPA